MLLNLLTISDVKYRHTSRNKENETFGRRFSKTFCCTVQKCVRSLSAGFGAPMGTLISLVQMLGPRRASLSEVRLSFAESNPETSV